MTHPTDSDVAVIAAAFERDRSVSVEERYGRLIDIIHDFAGHDSVRCSWPEGYGQWKNGDCACGLTEALREAGLPVDWAGGPPPDNQVRF